MSWRWRNSNCFLVENVTTNASVSINPNRSSAAVMNTSASIISKITGTTKTENSKCMFCQSEINTTMTGEITIPSKRETLRFEGNKISCFQGNCAVVKWYQNLARKYYLHWFWGRSMDQKSLEKLFLVLLEWLRFQWLFNTGGGQ